MSVCFTHLLNISQPDPASPQLPAWLCQETANAQDQSNDFLSPEENTTWILTWRKISSNYS